MLGAGDCSAIDADRVGFDADVVDVMGFVENNDGVFGHFFDDAARDLVVDEIEVVEDDDVGGFQGVFGHVVWAFYVLGAVGTQVRHGVDGVGVLEGELGRVLTLVLEHLTEMLGLFNRIGCCWEGEGIQGESVLLFRLIFLLLPILPLPQIPIPLTRPLPTLLLHLPIRLPYIHMFMYTQILLRRQPSSNQFRTLRILLLYLFQQLFQLIQCFVHFHNGSCTINDLFEIFALGDVGDEEGEETDCFACSGRHLEETVALAVEGTFEGGHVFDLLVEDERVGEDDD